MKNNDFLKHLPKQKQVQLLLLLEERINEVAPEHWTEAVYLMEKGLARGRIINESTSGNRGILCLHSFTPTAQGRDYAERLQTEAFMGSPQYKKLRFWNNIINRLIGSFWTIVTAVITELGTGYISRLLKVMC